MLRSILEGITMNLAVCLDILRDHVGIGEMTVVGGGARGEVWRQIMADIFGVDILVPEMLEEGGSMGAAVIGGVGAGIFNDFTAVDRFLRIRERRSPNRALTELYREKREMFDRLYEALAPYYAKMR